MDPLSLIRQTMPNTPGVTGGNPVLQRMMDAAGEGKFGKIPDVEMGQIAKAMPNQIMGTGGPGTTSFENVLGGLVKDVAAKQAQSSSMVNALLAGGDVPLHQAMISSEEASVSFQLMVEVRNKLLESYQELMRMQV